MEKTKAVYWKGLQNKWNLKKKVKRIFIWSLSVFHEGHTESLYKGQTAGFPDMD